MTESLSKIFAPAQSHIVQLEKQLQVPENIVGIPREFLRYDDEEAASSSMILQKILNKILKFKKWPQFWETGIITPIYQKVLQKLGCRVADHKTKCLENFSLQEFLLKYDTAVREISQYSAQLEVAHRKSSITNIKELQEKVNSVEAASENLVHIFHSLPQEFGRRFYLDIFKITKEILKALVYFISSLNMKESKSSRAHFKCTESIFTKCEDTQKMPKNNLESVLRFFHRKNLLLLDALQEIDEEVKSYYLGLKYGEDLDNSEIWNNQDRELLPPCAALLKTSRFCLKKVISALKSKGNCHTVGNIHELDEISFTVEDLIQIIHNFVTAIYPPMNQRDVKRDALRVVNTIQILLTQVQNSHFVQEEDLNWIKMLLKSVDHNNNKLQPLFSDERCSETTETDESDEDV